MSFGGGVANPNAELPPVNYSEVQANALARECLVPMGVTAENVAERYGVTRADQDQMAVESHAKALAAQAQGKFDAEIGPVPVVVAGEDGAERQRAIFEAVQKFVDGAGAADACVDALEQLEDDAQDLDAARDLLKVGMLGLVLKAVDADDAAVSAAACGVVAAATANDAEVQNGAGQAAVDALLGAWRRRARPRAARTRWRCSRGASRSGCFSCGNL